MKRIAIYLRVSTSKQDTENQRRELEAVAERSGWQVVKVYETPASAAPRAGTSAPGSRRVVVPVVLSDHIAGRRSFFSCDTDVPAGDLLLDVTRQSAGGSDMPAGRPVPSCFVSGSHRPGPRSTGDKNIRQTL
jgi:hypothetical protein